MGETCIYENHDAILARSTNVTRALALKDFFKRGMASLACLSHRVEKVALA